MRQLELIRREVLPLEDNKSPPKLDDEALRALVVLMAEAILAVVGQPEVDDER